MQIFLILPRIVSLALIVVREIILIIIIVIIASIFALFERVNFFRKFLVGKWIENFDKERSNRALISF